MSLIVLAGGIVLALLSPVVGWVIDRVGVRVPLAISFAAMITGYLVLSMTGGTFAYFFLLQLTLFAAGSFSGPVAFTRVVNQRFDAMRGLALGIALAGAGAMAVLAPPFIAHVIEIAGWRAGYRTVAATMAACAAVGLILLWPSGGVPGAKADAARARPESAIPRTDRALFLQLLVTLLLLALGIGGFTFHMVPLLTDAGVTLTQAAQIQSLIGLSVLAGRVGSGFLMDRFFAPRVSALIMSLAALGIVGLVVLGPSAAPACALLIGFALGTEGDVIGYLTARYFGLGIVRDNGGRCTLDAYIAALQVRCLSGPSAVQDISERRKQLIDKDPMPGEVWLWPPWNRAARAEIPPTSGGRSIRARRRLRRRPAASRNATDCLAGPVAQ
jgi:MFS family permease